MFEPLAKHHDKSDFDCGNVAINQYLKTIASQHHRKGIAKVYVTTERDKIIGFYTLSGIELDNRQQFVKGYPNIIPAVLIGRIGIDETAKGKGLSKIALAHALQMAKQASFVIGLAFVVIDAKTENLAQYYERFGFVRLPNELRLIYPISQI